MSDRLEKETSHSNNNLFPNELLTVQEVADYLRVSRASVWRWCKLGHIPAFRAGRSWRIYRDDLLKLESIPPAHENNH